MSILFDIATILIFILFAWIGYKRGFIKTLTLTVSTILSILVSNFIVTFLHLSQSGNTPLIILIAAFVVIYAVLSLLMKIVDLAAKLPIISTINKILGLACGVIFGYLAVAVLSFYLLSTNAISPAQIEATYILKYVADSATVFFSR